MDSGYCSAASPENSVPPAPVTSGIEAGTSTARPLGRRRTAVAIGGTCIAGSRYDRLSLRLPHLGPALNLRSGRTLRPNPDSQKP